MYYYIFDPKKCKKKTQVEAIKDQLAHIGISGEFTYVTGVQSASELAEIGLRKKYSTIVAVGSDDIINQVADKMVGKPEAMGIIPLEASAEIENVIGVRNPRDAIDVLRFRRIKEINLGMTGNRRHFITSAELELKKSTEITIEFKGYLVQAKVSKMTISNIEPNVKKPKPEYLDVTIQSDIQHENGILEKISGLFTLNKILEKNISTFRARSMRIFTNKSVFITSGGSVISKTPQYIESTDEKLRLIVGKHIED
ncbi:MAG: diacylglycerol kinase family protein [Patescibacteria group bacterium]|jgi:diacylglycerol kinase family enzyme